MKTLSIVVPVYYNEENLPDTVPQLLALQEKLNDCWMELIFVDDGSKDHSLEVLLDFYQQYPKNIRIIKLTRNFGSMAAIQAGFMASSGDCVAVIAADLQDPPELLLEMYHQWEGGTKVIFAVRQKREESFWRKVFSNTYYQFIRWLAIPDYPPGGFDFLLIDRQVVKELNQIREKNTNIMTLAFWLGFQPILIPYTRRARKKGKSRWTLVKKIRLFVDTFVSFSYFPIRGLSLFGFSLALLTFFYGGFVFGNWLVRGVAVQGWLSTVLVVTFTSGFQMMMLGVLGEYIWRGLDETRRRPPYIIDEVYGGVSKDALITSRKDKS